MSEIPQPEPLERIMIGGFNLNASDGTPKAHITVERGALQANDPKWPMARVTVITGHADMDMQICLGLVSASDLETMGEMFKLCAAYLKEPFVPDGPTTPSSL